VKGAFFRKEDRLVRLSVSKNDFFLFDQSRLERIELFDDIVFGRDPGSDVVIDDVMVSNSHFKIKIIDYEVYVIDLESSNKTIVNDVEIIPNKQIKLNPKDVIRVGSQEYAYSSGAVRKLNLPELSSTLKVGRFDEQSESSLKIERIENSDEFEDSTPGLAFEVNLPKQKVETGLKGLRNAKKYLDDLENVQKEIVEKIASLKKMRRRKIEVGAKMDQMKKILQESDFKTEKDFENELRIHRGTAEGYKMKIQKEEKEIAKAKAIIADAEETIAQAQFNISTIKGQSKEATDRFDAVNSEYDIYKNKTVFENEFQTLKETIKKYESLDLESKQEEVEKEIKLKNQQYKDMQNHYGAKLNSEIQLKKASSE